MRPASKHARSGFNMLPKAHRTIEHWIEIAEKTLELQDPESIRRVVPDLFNALSELPPAAPLVP